MFGLTLARRDLLDSLVAQQQELKTQLEHQRALTTQQQQSLTEELERHKALTAQQQAQLTNVEAFNRGWFRIHEPTAGAWQRNEEITVENVTAHVALFACVSLIASDMGKMRLRLVAQDADGIWNETENAAHSPVLRRPNHYQTRQKFIEWWATSKLTTGNTYILKRRDARNVVDALYVLDPTRVRVLVAPDGSVFYELKTDHINGLDQDVVYAPAREIIHDIYIALFHPLIGVSPIFACGLAALQGLKIQNNATTFFANGSTPGGVIMAPGQVSLETAQRIKTAWDTGFGGENRGKVAVLGDNMKYEAMTVPAAESQLIEQLKWTGEAICTALRVPPHKISVGQMPNYNNIESLDRQYYSQCLQEKIEAVEILLDEGLELPKPYGTEFDLDDLLRMDTAMQMKTIKEGVNAGVMKPNEGRKKLNLKPTEGGDTPYLQKQYWPLAQLANRPVPAIPASPVSVSAQAEEAAEKAISFELAVQRKAIAAGLFDAA